MQVGNSESALLEEARKPFGEMRHHTNLLVECAQDISSIDAHPISKNYADGKVVFYVRLGCKLPHGDNHNFSFLIGQHVLELGWPTHELINGSGSHAEAVTKTRLDLHQVSPVLILVGDFVDCPQGVIPSRVWAVRADEAPLCGSEFLFQSVLPGHPFIWEWVNLPGGPVDTAEGEPYARRSPAIAADHNNDGFIERNAKSLDDFHHVKSDIGVNVFLSARDYMRKVRISLSADGVGVRLKVPVDSRFEILKLARSTCDIFM